MSIQADPAQKRAKQKVAATLLGEAMAAGEAAVLVCDDQQLRYVAVNEAACALTGYSRDELLGMRAAELFPLPEERLHEGAKQVMAGAVHVGGGLLRTKDGEILEIGYVSERTRLDALDGFIVSLCWRLARERGQAARRRAAELRQEAEALRAQATVQRSRTQRVRRHPGRQSADTRPRLIFFYGETSGGSRRAEGFLAQVLQRRHNHDSFNLVRISAERHPELVERFAVTQLPTLVVVADGHIKARIEAPKGRQPIEQALAPWLR
jgi:PAS domain S-box-containing protein